MQEATVSLQGCGDGGCPLLNVSALPQLGSYLRHFRSPERLGTHVYAADAVPRLLRNNNSSSSSYELSPIAAHARLFREAAARLATQPSSRFADASMSCKHSSGNSADKDGRKGRVCP